ncbi:hypothetical protein A8990_110113 [Paenibacillus taihuensis]|uniref:Alpha/beta hydrolase family protein n=1 Tax=Paenibacillus taihuensis TaxID=1156355 RepID=A0A3D9S224_9BACL|nr:hypothetical protein [Paenibacillus taihuensis]REE86504.1 hypothetical protein A8990_110113 [Paenibacillus taihuensis]
MSSGGAAKGEVSLYLLAGLATAPLFMEGFRVALHGQLAREGYDVTASELLFPYGTWSRNVLPQIWEIGRDMQRGPRRSARSIGGRRTLAAIGESRLRRGHDAASGGGRTIFIGHSGGGVAAVHAAMHLLEHDDSGLSPIVVMIGSPRCRIPEQLRPSVLYVYATNAGAPASGGKITDAICKLGTFGGWGGGIGRSGESVMKAGRSFLPGWNHNKYGPDGACGVPIIGWHPDYFREQAPYVNGMGLTNKWLTLHAVWEWLRGKI